MKKCLAFFFAALLGVSAGIFAALSVEITAAGDSSMFPSYEEGDHLFVIKASGGIFSDALSVSAGDVILLENQVCAGTGEDRVMMKRVIGVSGDRVKIEDGIVYVNGKAVDESEYILKEAISGQMKERKVPGGAVFVLGDNRSSSTDSRSRTVGMVKLKNLLGKVIYKW